MGRWLEFLGMQLGQWATVAVAVELCDLLEEENGSFLDKYEKRNFPSGGKYKKNMSYYYIQGAKCRDHRQPNTNHS
jgi:hypothetical protein